MAKLIAGIPLSFAYALAGLGAVLAAAAPIPFGPRLEAGNPLGPTSAALCLQLYDLSGAFHSEMADTLVLLDRPVPASRNWFVASVRNAGIRYQEGMWRRFSDDSLEVRWHHSPSLRFAVRGNLVSGSIEPVGSTSLVFLPLIQRGTIAGQTIACPP